MSVGVGFAATVSRFDTPLTPVRFPTVRSASSFWKYQSTSPLSVIQPSSTITWIRLSGTRMFHWSACTAARALGSINPKVARRVKERCRGVGSRFSYLAGGTPGQREARIEEGNATHPPSSTGKI